MPGKVRKAQSKWETRWGSEGRAGCKASARERWSCIPKAVGSGVAGGAVTEDGSGIGVSEGSQQE